MRFSRLFTCCTILVLLFVPLLHAAPAATTDRLAQLERRAGSITSATARETGAVSFIRAARGRVLAPVDAASTPEKKARVFLAEWGDLMGMSAAERSDLFSDRRVATLSTGPRNSGSELRHSRTDKDLLGLTHVSFVQNFRGLPVLGGHMIVHMSEQGIVGVNGRFVPDVTLATEPSIPAAAARRMAEADFAKRAQGGPAAASKADLAIYRIGLLEGFEGENRLAWAVEVGGGIKREQIWIDARSGAVLNRISLHPDALYRIVYTPEYDPANPEKNVVRKEGDPNTFLPMVDNLYDFSGQSYQLFNKGFGRDSYDGAGATMRTVYLVNDVCPNAYWNGQSTNYCPAFDADDIVAHEWGHAYTQHTHNLIYSYQSGALNESYSDIWGETLDLNNGQDTLVGGSNNAEPYPAGSRWIIGEDLVGPAQNDLLTRDMWDPDRLTSPGKVTSPNYHCATSDGGGVHTNSGVPNHAYAMLVDGQTYNGQTVEGIGFVKASSLYFRAMTTYQFPSANFADHDQALQASCSDLIGAPLRDFRTGDVSMDVINANDCAQVAKAMLAVEMSVPPAQCNFVPLLDKNTPAACPQNLAIFAEDWENGVGGWTLSSNGVNAEWPGYNWELSSTLPDGESGTAALAVNHTTGTCAPGGDYSGTYAITSPAFTLPSSAANVELRFQHYVETELEFDGGNVKVSVNGGAFAVVPQTAYRFNAPKSQLAATVDGNTNPKAGEWAWNGGDGGSASGSWGVSVIDLSAVAAPGDSVRIQFDFGIDGCNGVTGWFVDDISVYSCPVIVLGTPTQNPIADDLSPDQQNGVDRDGKYKLSWTYPPAPAAVPCGYRIEEAKAVAIVSYADDAEELLVLGANTKWSGDVRWINRPHPTSGSLGYYTLYTDNSSMPLTMENAFAIPAGAGAELSFDSFEDVEEGFDFGVVEVSANGGSFERVAEFTGSFSGRRTINLSQYSGQSVVVQFRLVSDIVFSTPLYEGWYIDNIEIRTAQQFAPIGNASGTASTFDVTGRTDGRYSYRIAALFGDCGGTPLQGAYSNIEQQEVELGPVTQPPAASFTATPNPASVGQSITFDGSASADNDTQGGSPAIVQYHWSFGDGATHVGTTPATSHAYSSEGTYRARLTVTDNDGETADTELLIQVNAGSSSASGGGHITVAGEKANFGFDVSSTLGMASGSLNYQDHATKTRVQAKSITSVTRSGKRAVIKGTCSVDKQDGFTFTVEVTDNGSSGDTFSISVSNGYTASGTLTGGDIKVQ
jgi:bacillolysin